MNCHVCGLPLVSEWVHTDLDDGRLVGFCGEEHQVRWRTRDGDLNPSRKRAQ